MDSVIDKLAAQIKHKVRIVQDGDKYRFEFDDPATAHHYFIALTGYMGMKRLAMGEPKLKQDNGVVYVSFKGSDKTLTIQKKTNTKFIVNVEGN